MGITGKVALRTEIGARRHVVISHLVNFRVPAVYGDEVQGMAEGMHTKVEWDRSLEMKNSRKLPGSSIGLVCNPHIRRL